MQESAYEHKSYLTSSFNIKKHEITANTMYFLKEFIRKCTETGKVEDWLLTKRENQVIALMAEGLTNDEIAERLELSVNTIISNVTRIYDRYELSGKNARTQAVLIYLNRTGRLK